VGGKAKCMWNGANEWDNKNVRILMNNFGRERSQIQREIRSSINVFI